MTPWEPFLGPRLKIERADRHISDLNLVVTKFLERDPYTAIVERKPDSTNDCVVLHVREKLPNRLSTILGDAIHNLRAALDYLAVDLVNLNRGNTNGVKFPFCNVGDDLEKMIRERHIHLAAPDVVDVIRSLKPYHGGNDALRAIHDLDILDKHELLLPIGHVAAIPDILYSTKDTATKMVNIYLGVEGSFWSGALEDGAELVRLPKGHNLKIGQEFKPQVQIAFADGQPFERQPIIPTLHQFLNIVKGIVTTFERLCLGA